MTAIAVLQHVERGLCDLDEHAARIFLELENLEIISKAEGADDSSTLRTRKNVITLRQNLSARTILLTQHRERRLFKAFALSVLRDVL